MAETILVTANDSGGANLVASWCAENSDNRFVYCLTGPAQSIFSRLLGDVTNHPITELESLIIGADKVLCGTSEVPSTVQRSIKLARQHKVPSAVFIDHWFGYRRRFTRLELKPDDLSDEVWVTDEYGTAQAIGEGIPESVITVKGNPYIGGVARAARELGADIPAAEKGILFISEPIVNVPQLTGGVLEQLGYDEYQLMEDTLAAAGEARVNKIVIRLHPSESRDIYEGVLSRFSSDIEVTVSTEPDLANDLANSYAVVGSNSTALVVAAEAGVRTISYIPEGGRPCILPHDTIEKIRSRSVLAESLSKLVP